MSLHRSAFYDDVDLNDSVARRLGGFLVRPAAFGARPNIQFRMQGASDDHRFRDTLNESIVLYAHEERGGNSLVLGQEEHTVHCAKIFGQNVSGSQIIESQFHGG